MSFCVVNFVVRLSQIAMRIHVRSPPGASRAASDYNTYNTYINYNNSRIHLTTLMNIRTPTVVNVNTPIKTMNIHTPITAVTHNYENYSN